MKSAPRFSSCIGGEGLIMVCWLILVLVDSCVSRPGQINDLLVQLISAAYFLGAGELFFGVGKKIS